MKSLAILLITSALTFGFLPSETQAADKKTAQQRRADKQGKSDGRDVLFAVLDANGDGLLTTAELNNAATVLQTLDQNGDGSLTQEEIAPARGGKGNKERKGKKRTKQGKVDLGSDRKP